MEYVSNEIRRFQTVMVGDDLPVAIREKGQSNKAHPSKTSNIIRDENFPPKGDAPAGDDCCVSLQGVIHEVDGAYLKGLGRKMTTTLLKVKEQEHANS